VLHSVNINKSYSVVWRYAYREHNISLIRTFIYEINNVRIILFLSRTSNAMTCSFRIVFVFRIVLDNVLCSVVLKLIVCAIDFIRVSIMFLWSHFNF